MIGDWITGKGYTTASLWQKADVVDLLTPGAAGFLKRQ